MKISATLMVILIVVGWAFPVSAEKQPFQCSECHSKNPKLVRMHQAIGYKDCMLCHRPGTFRFGQASAVNTPTPEQAKRMSEDPVCQRCHSSGNTPR